MNPQPAEYIGQLGALIFICVLLVYAVKEYVYGAAKETLSDVFVIGYMLEEPKANRIVVTATTTTAPPQINRLPPEPPQDPPNDPPTDDPPVAPTKPKPTKSKKKKQITKNDKAEYKTIFEAEQLYIDCIDALYALGVKKTEAKKITKQVFTNKRPNSIQDFLMVALRK